MNIHEKHIELIEAVNNSATERTHWDNYNVLNGWRQAFDDMGRTLDLCACDMHYIDQGIERPMCCGILLDWKPMEDKSK